MRPTPALLSALFLQFLLLSLTSNAETKIKIGISVPLTGEGATWGNDIKNALLFANQDLANNRFDIVVEDDRCRGTDAATVAHKLIDTQQIKFLFGGCTQTIVSAAPIYDRGGVLVFAPLATSPEVSTASENIFRSAPSDSGNAKLLFDYISTKHKTIGVLTEESGYSQDLSAEFFKNNSENKLKIVAENYAPNEIDFRPVLMKFKRLGIDAIFINSGSEQSFAAVLKQLKQMNFGWARYASYFPASSTLRKLVTDEEINGTVFTDFPTMKNGAYPLGAKLVERFEASYGKLNSWDITLATTYEALRALDEALRSGEDVKHYLYTHEFTGVFGKYHFDRNGDLVGFHHALKQIDNGAVVELSN